MRKLLVSMVLAAMPLISSCGDYLPVVTQATLHKKTGTATSATVAQERGVDDLTVFAIAGDDTLEISVEGDNLRNVYNLNDLLNTNKTFRIPLNYYDHGVKFYFGEDNKGTLPASEFYFDN